MPKHTSGGSAAPVRVVIVTLDNHLASAAERAHEIGYGRHIRCRVLQARDHLLRGEQREPFLQASSEQVLLDVAEGRAGGIAGGPERRIGVLRQSRSAGAAEFEIRDLPTDVLEPRQCLLRRGSSGTAGFLVFLPVSGGS